MPNCVECGKPLRKIGAQRKNGIQFRSGANFNHDWKERKYHKKCYKLVSNRAEFAEYLYDLHKKHLENEKAKIRFRNLFMPYYEEQEPQYGPIYP